MSRLLTLLVLVGYVSISFAQPDEGDMCNTKDNKPGMCKLVAECSASRNVPYRQLSKLFSRCGFQDYKEIICCPEVTFVDRVSPLTERKAEKECKKLVSSLPMAITPVSLHIVNGEEAGDGEFPHMTALGYEFPTGIQFNCGGTLISERYILTAAHCIINVEGIEPSVARIGVIDLKTFDDNVNEYQIESIQVHPGYIRPQKYNDLALIRLNRPAVFSTGVVRPACLHTNSDEPKVMTVTGWGATDTNRGNQRSDTLLKANLTIVPQTQCNVTYLAEPSRKLLRGIETKQLCAGDMDSTDRADTCQGDSGGPLQYFDTTKQIYRLAGVTSFGKVCGTAAPGVYARVSSYLDWIEEKVWP